MPFCPCLMTKRCTGLVCQQIQPLSVILLIPKEELRTSGISIQNCCCPYLCIQFWRFNIWPCGLLFVPSICSSLLSITSALRWASRALGSPAVLNEPVLRHQELMKSIDWSNNSQSLPLIWWRWWSDNLWVTLIRLWPYSLSCLFLGKFAGNDGIFSKIP